MHTLQGGLVIIMLPLRHGAPAGTFPPAALPKAVMQFLGQSRFHAHEIARGSEIRGLLLAVD